MSWLIEGLLANWLSTIAIAAKDRLFPPNESALAKVCIEACAAADDMFESGFGDTLSSILSTQRDRQTFATLFVLAARTNLVDDLSSETWRILSDNMDVNFAGVEVASFFRHLALTMDALARAEASRPGSSLHNWYMILSHEADRYVGFKSHAVTHTALSALHGEVESLREELGVVRTGGDGLLAEVIEQLPGPDSLGLLHPVPAVPHLVLGRAEQLAKLDEWWSSDARTAVVYGPSGLGKSTLLARWLANLDERSPGTLRLYWSFDRDRSYTRFKAELEQRLEIDARVAEIDPVARLIDGLPPSALVVLDGLERVLGAYGPMLVDGTTTDLSVFRAIGDPELERLLLALHHGPKAPRLLIGTRVVPDPLLQDASAMPPTLISVGLLDTGSAEALFESLLLDPVEGAAANAVQLTRSPHTLRLIAGLLTTSRISPADLGPSADRRFARPLAPDAALLERLVARLPERLIELLAAAAALGGNIRSIERDALHYARSTTVIADDANYALSSIIVNALPSMRLGVYDYDSGGAQINPAASSTLSPSRVRSGNVQVNGLGLPYPDAVVADLTELELLGLLERDSEGWTVVPVVRDIVDVAFPCRKENLLIMAGFFARLLPFAAEDESSVVILSRIVGLLTRSGVRDLATDIFFGRLAHTLFFGNADYVLLRALVEELIGSQEGISISPTKYAHLLAFKARLLTKNRQSLAAVAMWPEHIDLRRRQHNPINVAAGLGFLAWDLTALGDFVIAQRVLEDAQREMGSGDLSSIPATVQAGMLWSFATNTYRMIGEYKLAEGALAESLACWDALGGHGVGLTNWQLDACRLHLARNGSSDALNLAEQALETATAAGYTRGTIAALEAAGLAALDSDAELGRVRLSQALALCRSHRYPELEPELLVGLARSELTSTDLTAASRHARAALSIAQAARLRPVVADATLCLLEIAVAMSAETDTLRSEAMVAAFGPRWRDYCDAEGWRSGWRATCQTDATGDIHPGRYGVWDWHSGYWAVMDRVARVTST